MNKITLIFIILLLPTTMIASSGVVVLQRGDIGNGWFGGGDNGIPIPRVTYDDTSITFTCDSTLAEVDIFVKDIQGNVLIEDTISLNQTYVLYHTPETMGHQRYLVELFFDDKYFYGYFDQ